MPKTKSKSKSSHICIKVPRTDPLAGQIVRLAKQESRTVNGMGLTLLRHCVKEMQGTRRPVIE